MRKIQIKWLNTYNAIIGAILIALGFTELSCAREKYGVPSDDYKEVMELNIQQPDE